jgi:hypothetical protein
MTDIDTDDTITTDQVVSLLLDESDAVRRYQVIQELQSGRLRDVAALSIRQLHAELGSAEEAADALGISRQAASELLAKAEAPSIRQDRDLKSRPTFVYGRWLATVGSVSWRLCRVHHIDLYDSEWGRQTSRWWEEVLRGTPPRIMIAKITAAVTGNWLPTLRRKGHPAGRQEDQLSELAAEIDPWVRQVGGRHLTEAELGDVVLGRSWERHQRRQAAASARPGDA